MQYKVTKIRVTSERCPALYRYFEENAALATSLYNAALFRIRQNFTGREKGRPTANELEVIKEIETTVGATGAKKPKALISYFFLEKLMRVTKNPDYFSGLPAQTAQQVLKLAHRNFKGWIEALKEYKKSPEKFTGKPKMPGYKKHGALMSFIFTNQNCVVKGADKAFLKFPKTKETLLLGNVSGKTLKEVQVVKSGRDFEVICIFSCEDDIKHFGTNIAAIDLGVDNLAAFVSNNGKVLLYKGNVLKSKNQLWNKKDAEFKSIAMKGHTPTEASEMGLLKSKRRDASTRKRNAFMKDVMHKISKDIVSECITHKIGVLVIGSNKGWKQGANIGKNTQTFVQMPFGTLKNMIRYKTERAGITVIEQEESYTSKADFLSGDEIPVYDKNSNEKYRFSGRRVSRGLYKSGTGAIVNADVNGACNILKKYDKNAFSKVEDFSFLGCIEVRDFKDLFKTKTCIPVKGIAAV